MALLLEAGIAVEDMQVDRASMISCYAWASVIIRLHLSENSEGHDHSGVILWPKRDGC